MTREAQELLERLLRLPADERALLVEAVEASLEDESAGPAEDPTVRAAWREEIARRLREYDEGKVTPIPADEVFADARALLEKARTRRGPPAARS